MTITNHKTLMVKIEDNRGVIKNKKKFEPMINDIFKYGSQDWIKECYMQKRFGLTFIWEVVTTLKISDQKLLIKDINNAGSKSINMAKMLYSKYL